MELKPDKLASQLAAGPLRPAWLVAGAEPLLVLEAADAVRAAARAEGITEREVFDADGRDFDWNVLEASLGAPSLFASRRLLEVRLPGGKPGKEGARVISGFCAAPPPDVVMLVTTAEWSRAHAGKWSEAIARVGHVVVAWPVKPHEQVDWIERRLRARGLRADRDAVRQLAELVEGNLLAAAQEIDKLALLAGGGSIDLQRMQVLVCDAARFDVFRLLEVALNGQAGQVSRMLAGLRAEGEAVPALLGMIVKEMQTCAALARSGNLAATFKALRIWDSKQAMVQRALGRHDASTWERFVVEAGRVDRIAKGRAPGDPWLVLERLLLAVAEPRALPLLG
jgi:DNA polymerase-3 subunit delta